MKGLQAHPERKDHIMVNLFPEGSMYIKPSELREVTAVTRKYTEVKYSQQRIRLLEPAERIQELIDAQTPKDTVKKVEEFSETDSVLGDLPEGTDGNQG